ncbi:hypothetical protein FRAHR75_290070 [Frankia sp. Hr75.2]|nr:hypothetical protein FRAHR75_290070 [Frankia sp. Hr75.2]
MDRGAHLPRGARAVGGGRRHRRPLRIRPAAGTNRELFTGPASAAASSRGGTRPWTIAAVYLFDAQRLLDELRARGVRTGTAASVRAAHWEAAEIFPRANSELLTVEPEQARLLRLFAPPTDGPR